MGTLGVHTCHSSIHSPAGNDSFPRWERLQKRHLFLGAANTLYYPLQGATIGAGRAYFQLSSGQEARSFKLNFGDETSSIVNGEWVMDNRAGAWYSLDGRKLSGKPTKAGLYIVNGKKVNVK